MSDPHLPPGPDDLFDAYVRRLEAGEDVDFEALCKAHADAAAELRRHEAARKLLERLLPGPLEEAGDEEQATVGLDLDAADDEALDAGTPLELLERLRGQRGNRYEVLHEIGRGGMGIVLRVRDTELRRKLAMKVALAHNDKKGSATQQNDTRALSRFLEEAQITSQIDHPGVVPVHEIGIDPDGRVFFTMRLVRGEDLRTIFSHVHDGVEGWNLVRAVLVLQKVCEAMSYAHKKKVLHRDLKPANVMVGRFGEVYVMDWGLARVLDREDAHDLRIRPDESQVSRVDTDRGEERDEEPDSPLMTMDGDVVGTPAYMSREQAMGQLDRLGPHSDVYSVGAMLYHLISGEVPYVPPGVRVSARTLRWRVIDGPPKPLHQFGRKAPAALVAICEKAMARAIEDRYPSMQALGEDLRAFVEGRVVAAYETGTWAETRMWVRRNRPLAASLVLAVLLLLVAVVMLMRSAEQARELAHRDRQLMQAEIRRDALVTLARIEALQRQGNEWDFRPANGKTSLQAWSDEVRELVEGSPATPTVSRRRSGLADYKQELLDLRAASAAAGGAALATNVLPFPRQEELELKKVRLEWYSCMLGKAGSAFPPVDSAVMQKETENLKTFRLNQIAWYLIDPRSHPYGFEAKALWLARTVVGHSEMRLAMESHLHMSRAAALTTLELADRGFNLAWALYQNAMFDEATRAMEWSRRAFARVRIAFPKALPPEYGYPMLESEIQRWQDGSAELEFTLLQGEVGRLTGDQQSWESYRTPDASGLLWHAQLNRIVDSLEALDRRMQGTVQQSMVEGTTPFSWSEAIAAIQSSPQYGGRVITPQLDLVPLGADPDSGLWEFAHLPSGTPPTRKSGNLQLTASASLVFVLLPAARFEARDGRPDEPRVKVELAPFFLSKYEMTKAQWLRLRPDWTGTSYWDASLSPANFVSVEDCVATLDRSADWLRLPTCAQWEYACWLTRSPRDRIAPDPNDAKRDDHVKCGDWGGPRYFDQLKEANFQPLKTAPYPLRRVGATSGNAFGLHDMFGNVCELCCDDPTPVAVPRDGDGLRAARGRPSQVGLMGGGSGTDPTTASWDGISSLREVRSDIGLRPARPLMP